VPHLLLEASAVLGVAAMRTGRLPALGGRRVAVVITGRSVGLDMLRRVLEMPGV
jgi:threonine dehydratase